ncbi:MAG: putative quinol monooxygenase [Planctomycetaceae bacterium]|jgi:quinol monooxygenase YgiN|nr:antibiotic biosynthesis monooxygenase [Planctomycetaceae bacterium]MDC0308176.1 antibiotic biosynthesis monooxygenase [Planctomycetaceae bacterium]MDG2389951.1 putative quinol monooxygenase [Planctomycetaceae bacterium]
MIHVVAQITLKPGCRSDFLAEFHQLVPLVHAEEGCLEYGPTIDAETPVDAQVTDDNLVVVVEKWESISHLEAHLVADHMQAYREQVKDMVVETSLQILSPA